MVLQVVFDMVYRFDGVYAGLTQVWPLNWFLIFRPRFYWFCRIGI